MLHLTLPPPVVDPAHGPVITQSLVLGAVQVVISLAVNAVIVVFAGSLASFLGARPRWQRVQRYLRGTVLAASAVCLITDRTQPSQRCSGWWRAWWGGPAGPGLVPGRG